MKNGLRISSETSVHLPGRHDLEEDVCIYFHLPACLANSP